MSRHYPRAAEITRVLQAVRASGMDVAGVEISPLGAIKVLDARLVRVEPGTEFDKWDREGRL